MNSVSHTLLSPAMHLITKIDQICQTDYRARLLCRTTGFHSSSYRFSTDQVAFIHIPKTGGTSISAILEQVDNHGRFLNLDTHRPVSQHCPPKNYQYITMLRQPVDRVYSYYRMAQRKDPDNPYSHLCGRGLEHFLTHCWETRNMCCRYLAGTSRKEVDDTIFKQAFENLSSFKFVGQFEHFEASIEQLMKSMDCGKAQIPHHRPSPKTQPTPEEYSTIAKYNEYDLRLYELYLQQNKFNSASS